TLQLSRHFGSAQWSVTHSEDELSCATLSGELSQGLAVVPEDIENSRVSRRLVAILAADIAGYSALMGADEEATVRNLKAHQGAVLPMIGDHGGRIIDTAGDGILAEFASVLGAVKCALIIQQRMAERNAAVDPAKRMQFRIGINQGDVIVDDARVYGD